MTVSKILTVAVAGLAMSTTAMAVNLVAPTQVIARVGGSCSTAVADALDFGTLSANLSRGVSQTDATSTITISCTNAIAFSVIANTGTYPNGGQRRMQAASGVYMAYDIFTTSTRDVSYPSTGASQTYTGNGNPMAIAVYGRIPAQTLTGLGTFQDVLTWSVTY
jgi:spore coat protein U-like protein